jgi:predicted O-methyltransferase YrrM
MRVNHSFFIQLARRAMEMEPYPDPRFPPSSYYRFLRLLAAHLHPSVSVELGVCGGGGSLHLALGWPKGRVIGVDVAWDHPDNIQHVQERCPNFEFWLEDSVKAAARFAAERAGRGVDVLFIDTTHTYDQTMREFEAWRPLLSRWAVVCLDDLEREEMRRVWAEMPGQKVKLDRVLYKPREFVVGFGVVWAFA